MRRRLRQSDHTRHPITLQAACCRECHAVPCRAVPVAGRRAKCIHAISYCVQSSRPYLISLSLRRTFMPNRSRPRCPVYDAFSPNVHGRATDNRRVCGAAGLQGQSWGGGLLLGSVLASVTRPSALRFVPSPMLPVIRDPVDLCVQRLDLSTALLVHVTEYFSLALVSSPPPPKSSSPTLFPS